MRTRWSLAVLPALALLGACSGGGGVSTGDVSGKSSTAASSTGVTTTSVAEPTSTSVAESTTTSVAVTSTSEAPPTSSTVAPTTAATSAPTTAAPTLPPPATTPPTTVPPLTNLPTNTNLQPANAITFTVPGGSDFCSAFAPAGWITQSCDGFVALGNFYVVVQRQSVDHHIRVLVMVPTDTHGHYAEEYAAEEPAPDTWGNVTVVHGSFHFGKGPFNGDAEGLWVGYRYVGSGSILDLDVIEWNEDGTAHRGAIKGLDHGGVDVHPGGADVTNAVYEPTDANCCPSHVLKRALTYSASANRWRINAGTLLDSSDPAATISSDF